MPAAADTLRIATYHTELSRKGPAVLLGAVRASKDKQVAAVLDVIAHVDADVILLLDVDWDHGQATAMAIVEALEVRGARYSHVMADRPNAGIPSGLDLDGNGRLGEARDALGYGRFTGDGGMLVLSKHAFGPVQSHSDLLWAEAADDVADLLPSGAEGLVPLATTAQWVIPLRLPGVEISLITLAAGTPVFDGPEDRNGRRNADELDLVHQLVSAAAVPIVMGRANIDPVDGEGDQGALRRLLSHPSLQDPAPRGSSGRPSSDGQRGDPAHDTVNWDGPGPLRVDYVLPAETLQVIGSGVLWPPSTDPFLPTVEAASRSRVVWVDVALP